MATSGKLPPSSSPQNSSPQNLTPAAQILLDLFENQPHELAAPYAQWVTSSKAFLAFAQKYQSKIRKKVRMSRDAEEMYNLYCELRTAYLLLNEPKFVVAYEAYGKDHGRSADYTVTFRSNKIFHVEVTRMRTSQQEQLYQREGVIALPTSVPTSDDQATFLRRYESRRLVDVVCDKFGQFSPDSPNILWVWSDSRILYELEIGQVMLDLKRRAEQRDPELFARHGFSKPADVIRYYQRLSAIFIQSLNPQETRIPLLFWQNKDAKHTLPTQISTPLLSLITSDPSLPFPTALKQAPNET